MNNYLKTVPSPRSLFLYVFFIEKPILIYETKDKKKEVKEKE